MSSESLDPRTAFYYNVETGQVEEGLVSDWTARMGPYRTRAEAENALALAAKRNHDWDEADREWDDED